MIAWKNRGIRRVRDIHIRANYVLRQDMVLGRGALAARCAGLSTCLLSAEDQMLAAWVCATNSSFFFGTLPLGRGELCR